MVQSAIQNLNALINEEYTVEITCDRSKVLDIFEEGETKEVFFTSNFYQRSFETRPHNLSAYLKAAIENVLKHYTQFSSMEECMKKNFNYSDNDLVILQQITESLNKPTNEDYELWKKGETNLYNQYTHIKVKINSTSIGLDLILDLLKEGEQSYADA